METSTAAPPDGRPVVGALKKNSLGTGGITFLVVSAAAPLTVIAGIVPLASLIGGPAAPLAYLVVGLALAVFAVGFMAMTRHVTKTGGFYTYITEALGRHVGLGAGILALVSYNAMQIGIYGLFAGERTGDARDPLRHRRSLGGARIHRDRAGVGDGIRRDRSRSEGAGGAPHRRDARTRRARHRDPRERWRTGGFRRGRLRPPERAHAAVRGDPGTGIRRVHRIRVDRALPRRGALRQPHDPPRNLPGRLRLDVLHRIEHLELTGDDIVQTVAASGAIASMQPTHCTHFITDAGTDNWSGRVGSLRARHAWRTRSLIDAGTTLALGSDWPIAPFEPLQIMADARLRRRVDRPDRPPVLRSEGLTAMQAINGYTRCAAIAAGVEHEEGAIRPGALADLTALAGDPLAVSPEELAELPVLATIVGGEVRHLV